MKRYACVLFPGETPYYSQEIPAYGSYSQALSLFLDEVGKFEEIFGLSFDSGNESSILRELNANREVVTLSLTDSSWKGIFQGLWQYFSSREPLGSPEQDEFWFFWGDSPFMNPKLALEIESLFQTYRADFAFADGYPKGIGIEILGFHRLLSMVQLSQLHDLPVSRSGVFDLIQKDINSFHIETRMAEGDHRLTRLELHGQYRRTHTIVVSLAKEFFEARNTDPWDDEAFELPFLENRYSHRSLPAAVNLQLIARCPHSCTYCPYPVINPGHLTDPRIMELQRVKILVQKLISFMPEGTISLSGLGEPALHPDILAILFYLDQESPYSVTVETTGVGWPENFFEFFERNPLKKTKFIIGLDTNNPDRYASLGKIQFEKAHSFARDLLKKMKEHVFIQAIRLSGGEEDLLKFYQEWESITPQVIIQKYDTFGGILPDRKVVDLQPLRRFPCWHIKRELTILVDGTVVRCKEDVDGADSAGNAFTHSLEEVWKAYDSVYNHHRNEEYPGICGNCDEYYTFNY
ncbi:MAG: spiro-SPASM protein [Spirochaetales bacterium]|nr:spiro-SPASM protein [Spirochaetales bacterium]